MAIKVIAQRREVKLGKNPGSSTDNQGGTDNQSQGGGTDSGDENLGDGD